MSRRLVVSLNGECTPNLKERWGNLAKKRVLHVKEGSLEFKVRKSAPLEKVIKYLESQKPLVASVQLV